jgi:hypothetical protein
MWRVALSTIAILIDALVVLVFVIGLAHSPVRVTAVPMPRPPPPEALRTVRAVSTAIMVALFGLNIAAILFGARLRRPGARRGAVARIFE